MNTLEQIKTTQIDLNTDLYGFLNDLENTVSSVIGERLERKSSDPEVSKEGLVNEITNCQKETYNIYLALRDLLTQLKKGIYVPQTTV